jgi:hypothetical protein
VPFAHCTQSEALSFPSSGKNFPASHFVHSVLPLECEYVPALQSMQDVAPAILENFPAWHLTHEFAEVAANAVE